MIPIEQIAGPNLSLSPVMSESTALLRTLSAAIIQIANEVNSNFTSINNRLDQLETRLTLLEAKQP